MKKIFTLFFALFAITFLANAQQVTLILEAHDVWGDGSGYQLLLDADHTAFGTVIPTSGALTSNATATVDYSATFEYTIPTNADGNANSTNTVVDGSVTITIPAGTYDFCVTNPTPGDRIWIAAGDNGRKDDYVFDPDYIYHFTVARNGDNDGVTIELIPNTTDPTIITSTTAIDFGTVNYPGTGIATANISAYNLTAGITATTTAPFEVSANGTAFGTTATIAQTGGTLYVKYTPTAAGTDNGTVTLTSGTATVSISLTGNAYDCSNITLPLTESFESADCPATCWTIVYGDNDATVNTMIHTSDEAVVGTQSFCFTSYDQSTDYTQYLITPALPTIDKNISFQYKTNYGTEVFSVGYSTTSNDIASFTWSEEITATNSDNWLTYSSVIPASAVYIAIKYNSDYAYYLYIDDFQIQGMTSPTLSVSPNSMSFFHIMGDAEEVQTANIIGSVLSDDITISVTGPFGISMDGSNYGTTATIAQTAGNGTLYVKYTPTTAGTHTGTVTVSTSGATDATITLEGTSITCDVVTTFPFTENFEDTSMTLPCWTINDVNNDGKTFSFVDGEAQYTYHSTNPADDWLISPEMTLTGNQLLSVDYRARSTNYPEKFMVAAINGSTITLLTDTINVTTATNETQYVDLSSLNGTYKIGIHCVSEANEWNLYIDNFVIYDVSEATLSTDPTDLTFNGIMGQASTAQTVAITGIGLTDNITISAPANFEVSADNTAFGNTATITVSGLATQASLYVRYNPTTAGSHTGTITLTSGTTTVSINVNGNAVDCSEGIASLPFTHDFNDRIAPPSCWNYNNEENFLVLTIDTATNNYAIAVGTVDYLITPEIHSTSAMNMSIDYHTYGGINGIEASSTFRIGYSSTNDNYSSFTWMEPVVANQTGENFFNYSSVLPAGTKHVAIDITEIGTFTYGFSSYYNYLFFDNFSLEEVNNPVIYAGANTINFGSVNINTNTTETVAITGALLTEDITATTTAPFEVSADNSTFGTTATIPAAGGNLYVRYAPTTAGAHTGNVTLASTGATSVTISLSGNAVDCSSAASLPFFEGFESELNECWTLIDNDGDGYNWHVLNNSQSQEGGFVVHSGEGHITSASWSQAALTPDNWLITPAINLSENATLSFWVAGQDPSYAAENFSVYLSTTGTDINNFNITLLENQTSTAEMTEFTADLSAYTGNNVHIAFRHHNVTDMFRLNLDDVSVTAGVGIKNAESGNVTVYPNPAYNYINVNATSNINNVEVYTIAGQKVGDFTANGTQTVISTANLSNGMYMMRINTENGVINKKFSVAR